MSSAKKKVVKNVPNDTKISRSFKKRLQSLDCPYTDGVDESWIIELIFTPGEPRIRLLQWLFSRLDSKLQDFIEPPFAAADSRVDGRLERLLFVSSALGLCKRDELDVIQGACGAGRQTAYMDLLLDLVCVTDAAADTQARELQQPGIVSDSTPLEDQSRQDLALLSTLLSTRPVTSLFTHKVDLLPPDLRRTVRHRWENAGATSDKPPQPDISGLLKELDSLASQLTKAQNQLQRLKDKHAEAEGGDKACISRQLRLSLSEAGQLMRGFSAAVESELRAWCRHRRSAAEAGDEDLHGAIEGARVARLDTMTGGVVKLLEDMCGMRECWSRLHGGVRADLRSLASADAAAAPDPDLSTLSAVSARAQDTLDRSINVLEESVRRRHGSLRLCDSAAT